jgi:hypothetical protein
VTLGAGGLEFERKNIMLLMKKHQITLLPPLSNLKKGGKE